MVAVAAIGEVTQGSDVWDDVRTVNAKQKRIWNAVIERDGGMCIDCAERGHEVPACEVHHIASRRRPWAWCAENMITLCWDCHHGSRNAHTHARRVHHLRLLRERYGYEHDERWMEWSV